MCIRDSVEDARDPLYEIYNLRGDAAAFDEIRKGEKEQELEQATPWTSSTHCRFISVDITRSDVAEDEHVVVLPGLVANNSRISAVCRIEMVPVSYTHLTLP